MANNNMDGIRTKVVGTTSGEEGTLRQLALKKLSELPISRRPKVVDLVPEPDNPFDPHAIRIMCDHPELGRVQLGFVRNRDCVCDTCGTVYTSVVQKCTMCGEETIRRNGLASQIAMSMEEDPNIAYYAEILEITGGTEGKDNFGMNILIRSVIDRSNRPWSRSR